MNMPVTGLWPAEHSDMLRKLLEEGKSFAIAAAEINRAFDTLYSRSAAIGRANRMGIVRSKVVTESLVTRREKKPRAPRPSRSKVVTESLVTRREKKPRAPRPSRSKIVPKIEPREVIELRCAEIEPRHIELIDLEAHHCRYPYGEGPFTFCGHSVTEGQSYCSAHWQLCLLPEESRRARNLRRAA